MSYRRDITFCIGTQDGIPGDNKRDLNWTCPTSRKPSSSCYWTSWNPVRTTLFPLGPRMGPKDKAPRTKIGNVWQVDKPCQVLLNLMRFHLVIAFSNRTQDGTQRRSQREETWKWVTGRKTLSNCCWNLWGPIKTALFLSRPRMWSPGIAKGTKIKNVWQVHKPYQVLLDFMRSHLDVSFFQ
jgi:hypothetical protein